MTQQTLQAMTTDDRIYTVDLSDLLAPGQTITSVTSITDATGTLTLGTGTVNTLPVTLQSGAVIPVGQAVQIEIKCATPTTALNGQQSVTLEIILIVATNTDRAVTAVASFFLCDTPGVNPDGCGC